MSSTPPPYFAREMRADDLERDVIQSFDCGAEPWETQISDYLVQGQAWKDHKPPKSVTILHFADEREEQLVGFYNIAKYSVRYPKFEDESRLGCYLITYVGVATAFKRQGKLKAMISDIATAAILSDLQGIYLFVDARNEAAIAAYERLGFRPHTNAPLHREDGVDYNRMILPLL